MAETEQYAGKNKFLLLPDLIMLTDLSIRPKIFIFGFVARKLLANYRPPLHLVDSMSLSAHS